MYELHINSPKISWRKSIIMISSDMPELIAMSDRIMVMRGGRIVAELAKEEINEETILKHAIGSDAR